MALGTCTYCAAAFISVKMFPILIEAIDLYGCLLVYSFGSTIGFVFILFVLKETTGKSLDNIGVAYKSTADGVQTENSNNP